MKVLGVAASAALLCMGASAQAVDSAHCAARLVCASTPQTVFEGLQRAGITAEMDVDGEGDPMIVGESDGLNFGVYFYGCEDHAGCDSLQFLASFTDAGATGPSLANAWNDEHRFSQLSLDSDGNLNLRYDVTTIGGLNQANFAEVVDWWTVVLGNVANYIDENAQ